MDNLRVQFKEYTDPVSVTRYKYYRLYITENNGNATYTGLAELELRTIRGGSNIATGGTATAIAGDHPEYAFNGNKATDFWQTGNGSDLWLKYEMTIKGAVREYAIWAPDSADKAPKSWELQGSNDNATWVTLDSQSDIVFATAYSSKIFVISAELITWEDWSLFLVDAGRLSLKVESDEISTGGIVVFDDVDFTFLLAPTIKGGDGSDIENLVYNKLGNDADISEYQRLMFRISGVRIVDDAYEYEPLFEGMLDLTTIKYTVYKGATEIIPLIKFSIKDKLTALNIVQMKGLNE